MGTFSMNIHLKSALFRETSEILYIEREFHAELNKALAKCEDSNLLFLPNVLCGELNCPDLETFYDEVMPRLKNPYSAIYEEIVEDLEELGKCGFLRFSGYRDAQGYVYQYCNSDCDFSEDIESGVFKILAIHGLLKQQFREFESHIPAKRKPMPFVLHAIVNNQYPTYKVDIPWKCTEEEMEYITNSMKYFSKTKKRVFDEHLFYITLSWKDLTHYLTFVRNGKRIDVIMSPAELLIYFAILASGKGVKENLYNIATSSKIQECYEELMKGTESEKNKENYINYNSSLNHQIHRINKKIEKAFKESGSELAPIYRINRDNKYNKVYYIPFPHDYVDYRIKDLKVWNI